MSVCVRILWNEPDLTCFDPECSDHGELVRAGIRVKARRERRRYRHPRSNMRRRELVRVTWGEDCYLCDATPEELTDVMTIDHVIPQSKGGSNDIENLRMACSHCNRWKGDRLLDELGGLDVVRERRIRVRIEIRRQRG